MTKFLLLYRSTTSAQDQMADATPEQAQEGLDAWMTWAGKAGSAILDLGSPTATVATLGKAPDQSGLVGGYSLMEAESTEALEALLDGHPHLMTQDASIEVCELLPMPGS